MSAKWQSGHFWKLHEGVKRPSRGKVCPPLPTRPKSFCFFGIEIERFGAHFGWNVSEIVYPKRTLWVSEGHLFVWAREWSDQAGGRFKGDVLLLREGLFLHLRYKSCIFRPFMNMTHFWGIIYRQNSLPKICNNRFQPLTLLMFESIYLLILSVYWIWPVNL